MRGNHDTVGTFQKYFPWSDYKDVFEGSYNNSMMNTYRTLVIGENKYLLITLDYGANDAILAWASDLCEEYPDHNVIITTHAYLFRDGTTLDQRDVCPPATTGGHNNGDHMWSKLISKHENIVLVISGHDPSELVVVSQQQGEHGNTVTQMLVDPQTSDSGNGGLGLIAMLYFSEDGRNVTIEYYSVLRKKFYQSLNQFSFTLDTLNSEASMYTDSSLVTQDKADPNVNTGCSSTFAVSSGALLCLMLVSAVAVSRKKKN